MYRAKNDRCTSVLRVLVCLLAFLGILTTGQSVRAQSSNGQITGLITDSSGAAVQDAKMIATNTETGVTYVSTTNGSGVYVLSQLVPGLYKVSLSKEGFGPVERTELTVHTGDHLSIDLSIKPATTRETVTVTESAPLLQSDQ